MKNIVFILFFCLSSVCLQAQKIIEKPEFAATSCSTLQIEKITLYDTSTVIDFSIKHIPYWDIWLDSREIYIRSSAGGEKLHLTGTKDIQLDTRDQTPESGISTFTLYFPPLDPEVEVIDFYEVEWQMYEIELVPQQHLSFIPEDIQGNWLKADGANQWELGIYKEVVIYDNQIWPKVSLRQNKKDYWLLLKNDEEARQVHFKLKKDKLIMDQDNAQYALVKDQPGNDVFSFEDPDWTLKLEQPDTAIYMGYLDGYHPKMGSTGKIFAYNVFSKERSFKVVEINEDGSFHAKVPLMYPQVTTALLGNDGHSVFLKPGDTLIHYIDINQHTRRDLKDSQLEKLDKNALFMGKTARINHDLLATEYIGRFNRNKLRKRILDMDIVQFRDSLLNIVNHHMNELATFTADYPLSEKAQVIKERTLLMSLYSDIFMYNNDKENAYRQKHDINYEEYKENPLERQYPENADYFSFIHVFPVNDPRNLLTGSVYYFFVNRLQYADVNKGKNSFSVGIDEIFKKMEIDTVLTADEMVFVEDVKTISDQEIAMAYFKDNEATWNGLLEKIRTDLEMHANKIIAKQRKEHMDSVLFGYFKIGDGLFKDAMTIQTVLSRMESTLEPLTEQQMAHLKKEVKTPEVYNYAVMINNQQIRENEAKLKEFENSEEVVRHETPAVGDEEIFDAIMEKYPGKLVYVDFWATWCGPCRSGIKRIKPLKEKLKDKDIVFVYITNPTSPDKTYELMLPDIPGEHYKVSQDQWNYMGDRFNITGIPHYVLVDKDGKVLKNNFRMMNNQLEELFSEYIEL